MGAWISGIGGLGGETGQAVLAVRKLKFAENLKALQQQLAVQRAAQQEWYEQARILQAERSQKSLDAYREATDAYRKETARTRSVYQTLMAEIAMERLKQGGAATQWGVYTTSSGEKRIGVREAKTGVIHDPVTNQPVEGVTGFVPAQMLPTGSVSTQAVPGLGAIQTTTRTTRKDVPSGAAPATASRAAPAVGRGRGARSAAKPDLPLAARLYLEKTPAGKTAIKDYSEYLDALRNYETAARVMADIAANPENVGSFDAALLGLHMANVLGPVKGLRGGMSIIEMHKLARSWPESVEVAYKRLTTGDQLSPAQRQNFFIQIRNFVEVQRKRYERARSDAVSGGLGSTSPLAGEGTTGSGGPPQGVSVPSGWRWTQQNGIWGITDGKSFRPYQAQ